MFALLTTGSYIGIALLGFYLLYLVICVIFRYFRVPSSRLSVLYRYILAFTSYILVLYIAYHRIDPEKLLSLMSRFILMKESLIMMFREPLSLLIGFGPDSLASHFSIARSTVINSYFPNNEIIDSSHNILIDIVFQYGIFPIILISSSLIRSWKNQKEYAQAAILLGV